MKNVWLVLTRIDKNTVEPRWNVTLVMDNATIDGNGGPTINVVSGDSLTVRLPEGTNNRMNSLGDRADCMSRASPDRWATRWVSLGGSANLAGPV